MGAQYRDSNLDVQSVIFEVQSQSVETLLAKFEPKRSTQLHHGRTDFESPRENHGPRRGGKRAQHHRDAGFEDSRLLGGDLAEAAPELFGVFKLDTGHAGDCGDADVGRVEASPETRLQHREVDGGLPEEDEGGCRGDVEERGRQGGIARAQGVDVGAHSIDDSRQRRTLDVAAVDSKAFRPGLQVRRSEGPDAPSGGPKNRLAQERRRTLAL